MANVFKCRRSDCEFNCGGCYCELEEITIDEYGCCEDYTHCLCSAIIEENNNEEIEE